MNLKIKMIKSSASLWRVSLPILVLISTMITSHARKTGLGQTANLGVSAKVSEEITVGLRAGLYVADHREQFDQVHYEYDSTGLSGTEFALTGQLYLGTLGKAIITGIGELAIYNRAIPDSVTSDAVITPLKYRQYLPRTGIHVHIPTTSGFSVDFNNLFERRIITLPEIYTIWIWRPLIRITTPTLSQFNIASFVEYEGLDHQDQSYMATAGFGFKGEPMQGLKIGLADRISWFPDKPGDDPLTVHNLVLQVDYTFDWSRKN